MLTNVTWAAFGAAVLYTLIPYYMIVISICYRGKVRKLLKRGPPKTLSLLILAFAWARAADGQNADGNNGINEANTLIRSYFQTGTQLMYAIGAIVGLVGAVRVFVLWNSGHREEMGRAAGAWFGSCIFLVVVALIIQSFFGL